ncbi:MAG: S41 family peptidase [Rhizomicrobium sp.]
MNRRDLLFALMAATLPFPAFAGQCTDAKANAADIEWLIGQIAARYAYLPDRHVDLDRMRALYVAQAGNACDPHVFLGVLERCLAELHDHHVEAGVNNSASPQLVPTGAEAWAAFHRGRAVIEAVRPGSGLMRAGARAGDEVVAIGGVPAAQAVAAHAPRALAAHDPEADDYTLRVLLAGTHEARRVFTLRDAAGEKPIALPPHRAEPSGPPLTLRRFDAIACIRIENSLGDSALVPAFDRALEQARDARGLILDLRNTPSGGNTDVAEPILGRFVTGRPGYQRVFDPAPGKSFPKDGWTRWVRSRGETVTQPLVVLCGRWTGSMGEGMTIGFDGLKRATVVGTRMAGLCGATQGFTLPGSGITVQFPVERLYHLDGTPREKWTPPIPVDLAREAGDDPVLARGLAVLHGKMG